MEGEVKVQRTEIALQILRQRQWQRKNMPIPGSSVAVEVIFYLLTKSDTSITRVKDIHLELGYSEDRVGVVIKTLSERGLVHIAKQSDDNRARNVRASEELHDLLEKFIDTFSIMRP